MTWIVFIVFQQCITLKLIILSIDFQEGDVIIRLLMKKLLYVKYKQEYIQNLLCLINPLNLVVLFLKLQQCICS